MSPEALDEFLKGTCVIIVFAYLLTRRPLRVQGWLGPLFGLVGLVELWVTRERSPYDTYTLIITFAALRYGVRIGGLTTLIVALGAPLFLHAEALLRTWLSLAVSLGAGLLLRRWPAHERERARLPYLIAIVLAELGAILARSLIHSQQEIPFSPRLAVLKIGANGIGAVVLQLVLSDAQTRLKTEELRLEIERSRTRLAESQLAALQARIHPHFLFNALTSIAALCRIAPLRAEAAIVLLGQLMRRALESSPQNRGSLEEELSAVDDYLELESLRLGARLQVVRQIESGSLAQRLPPFVVQTLVENAILHGIGPTPEPATLTLTVRPTRSGSGTLVAIHDTGMGMEPEELRTTRASLHTQNATRPHGLPLANEQLTLLFGPMARLRLFARTGRGTLVAFWLPALPPATSPSPQESKPR